MNPPADTEHPLVGKEVVSSRVTSSRDPFEALDDLMTVIEVLCPRWPARSTFSSASKFLL
jgi:hypothetical protein